MSSQEFVLAVKLWLGIPLFNCHSNPVRFPCGQVIDPYGHHLLECGHDGNRTRRHDALPDVVWHALEVDNKEAKIERRCCGDSRSRPGDIYHPDFLNGTPAFFDITEKFASKTFSESSVCETCCSSCSGRREGSDS